MAAAGERARTAATYGLLASNAMVNVLVAATAIRVFTFRPESKGSAESAKPHSRKNPKLVRQFYGQFLPSTSSEDGHDIPLCVDIDVCCWLGINLRAKIDQQSQS